MEQPQIDCNQTINLPNSSVKNIISRSLIKLKINDVRSLLNDKIGSVLFCKYCQDDNVYSELLNLYNQIVVYSKLPEFDRAEKARSIFNNFLIKYSISAHNPFTNQSLLKIVKGINLVEINKNSQNGQFLLQNSFFENIEEEIYQLLSPKYKSFLKSKYFIRYCQWKDVELSLQPTFEDFNVLQILSKGSYSVVCLCEKIETKKQYALKCIKIENEEILKDVYHEVNMLKEISQECNFIVGLNYAFAKNKHIYLILDLMEGGALTQHIYARGSFNSAAIVHFTSQIVLALSYLHSKNIVSRDVNPSNILLDKFGHAKIKSLRLAENCKTQNLTSKTGTVGFMAPEVIQSNGEPYGPSVDIFSLGCLVYKLATGHSPFSINSNNVQEIECKTLKCQFELPAELPENLNSLIRLLLARKSEERPEIEEIKNHEFFKHVDWNRALENKYDSPFIPPAIKIHKPTCKVDPYMIFSYNKKLNISNFDFKDKNFFSLGVGSRWQQEIIDCGLFQKTQNLSEDVQICENLSSPYRCVVEGEIFLLTNPILMTWQKRNLFICHSNLVLAQSKEENAKLDREDKTVLLENVSFVSNQLERHIGMNNCILVVLKTGKHFVLTGSSLATSQQWCLELYNWWNKLNSNCSSPDNPANNSSAKAVSM